MDPSLTASSSASKLDPSSPTTLRPGPSSLSSSVNSTTTNSNWPNPKLTMPTPPATPSSSPSTASPRTSPNPLYRSSSLSTPTTSPLRQPIRSLSQGGRSQLNAASTGNPMTGSSAAGGPATVPQTPPTPEQGENQNWPSTFTLHFFRNQCSQQSQVTVYVQCSVSMTTDIYLSM